MPTTRAEHPQDARGRQYHVGLSAGEVAPVVLLCGEVERAGRIAEQLDHVSLERRNREYHTFTGTWRGHPISAMATGMGPDNTEIAVVEVCQLVERPVLLRVGSCGALPGHVSVGDLVISTGALRYESTSTCYAPMEYPALAHPEVVMALAAGAARVGHPHHVGLTASVGSFYAGQGRSFAAFPSRNQDRPLELTRLGVLNMEMEASALFVLGGLAGLRTGAVCAAYANRESGHFVTDGAKESAELAAICTALEAVDVLARMDSQRQDAGAPLWHPGLSPPGP